MSKKFYTRKEAADILGVHPQSVSNYAAKGLLHEVRSGNYVKFIKEEVDALSTIPAIHSYEEIRAKAEEVEAKELELLANMTRRLEERTAEFKDLFTNGHPERWYRYRELVLQVVRLAADEALKQNEKEILWSVLELDTLQEVADRFQLTRERIRQVFEKALRHVINFRDIATSRYEAANKTIEDLKKEITGLRAQVMALEHPELGKPAAEAVSELEKFRDAYPFNQKLKDIGLSVRSLNCMRACEIETVGELVALKMTEITKCRNFGRKSLNELQELLCKMNLEFGMWRNPDYDYSYLRRKSNA